MEKPPSLTALAMSRVAGGHRAVELTGLTGLADDDEALAGELGRYGFGLGFELEVARLELGTLALEAGAIGFGGAQRLAMRQEIIAGKAVLDRDHVAHLSEAADALKQDHLHVSLHSFQVVPLPVGG
jgi:hypothetical protein